MRNILLLISISYCAQTVLSSHNDYPVIWCTRKSSLLIYADASTTDAEAYAPDEAGGDCLSYTERCIGFTYSKGSAPSGLHYVGTTTGCDVDNLCETSGAGKNGCQDISTEKQGLKICCCDGERCEPNSGRPLKYSVISLVFLVLMVCYN